MWSWSLYKTLQNCDVSCSLDTHLWTFSKSKLNLKYDRVNLVAPTSPIESALFTQCPAIQYKLGPERLTRLGNSNVLRLPVWNIQKKLSSYPIVHGFHCIPDVSSIQCIGKYSEYTFCKYPSLVCSNTFLKRLQGYPQRMIFKRRLYRIYAVYFHVHDFQQL